MAEAARRGGGRRARARAAALALTLSAAAGAAAADGFCDAPDLACFEISGTGGAAGVSCRATAREGGREDSRLAVRVDAIAYGFEHCGRELWVDGRLAFFRSSTDESGMGRIATAFGDEEVELRAEGGGLRRVGARGAAATLPADAAPDSHWRRAGVGRGPLFDMLTGAPTPAEVTGPVADEIALATGARARAERFALQAESWRAEAWYVAGALARLEVDRSGRAVSVRAETADARARLCAELTRRVACAGVWAAEAPSPAAPR